MNELRLGIVLLAVALCLGSAAMASNETTSPDTATASEIASTLRDALAARDADAILRAADAALAAFEKSESKSDRARLVKAVAAMSSYRSADHAIALRSAAILGDMGADASPTLIKLLKDRRVEKQESMRPVLIARLYALGMTAAARAVEPLSGYLKHEDTDLVNAAAEALANFDEVKQTLRKEIVRSLVETLESANNQIKDRGGSNPRYSYARYQAISASILRTLQSLTGESFFTSDEWREWYNANRKRDWDREDDE